MPWHRLYLKPKPHGHSSFRPTSPRADDANGLARARSRRSDDRSERSRSSRRRSRTSSSSAHATSRRCSAPANAAPPSVAKHRSDLVPQLSDELVVRLQRPAHVDDLPLEPLNMSLRCVLNRSNRSSGLASVPPRVNRRTTRVLRFAENRGRLDPRERSLETDLGVRDASWARRHRRICFAHGNHDAINRSDLSRRCAGRSPASPRNAIPRTACCGSRFGDRCGSWIGGVLSSQAVL